MLGEGVGFVCKVQCLDERWNACIGAAARFFVFACEVHDVVGNARSRRIQ